ncbi:MAG: BAR-domain-containing protein [Piptocephalis tieghemiana]|nr:MAG: BAR-domain-containing protein [Piptocephalis tieghemiana]
MSWSGILKSVNRAGTSLMQKTGHVDRTQDHDFDEEERRYKALQNKTERLQREAKAYLDALRAMSLAQVRVGQTVARFHDDPRASASGRAALGYAAAVESLDAEVRGKLDADLRATVLDPLGRLCALFPQVDEACKRRQRKLLDYDSARTKVRKLTEKPSDDPNKLPQAEAQCKAAYESYQEMHTMLMTELPKLVDLRVPYLDPTFEALVKVQAEFAREARDRMGGWRGEEPALSEGTDLSAPNSSGQLIGEVDGVLDRMRELSICGLS